VAEHVKRTALAYGFIAVWLLFCLFPIYWMVITSLKPQPEWLHAPPLFIPQQPSLDNYVHVALGFIPLYNPTNKPGSLPTAPPITGQIINSVIISLSVAAVSLFLGALSGYGFARLKIRAKQNLMFWILSQRMFPPIAMAIPLYILFTRIRLTDTYAAVILADCVVALPFAVWMMQGFIQDIPAEIEESAMVDGCSRFGVFIRIVLPLVAPGLVATAVFCWLFSWNDFLFALMLTRLNAKTLPVAMAGYISNYGVVWGDMTAASMIAVMPPFIFVFLVQRYLVRGLTFGAVKG
jgi:multiple sugar transport system permease protein